jgi:outer membrane lipoprotein SlyB
LIAALVPALLLPATSEGQLADTSRVDQGTRAEGAHHPRRWLADNRDSKPLQTVSVQFMPTRHLVVEGEFGRWNATWDYRVPNRIFPPGGQTTNGQFIEAGALEGWSAGVNLLYRTEPRRMSAFVGGGPFVGSERYAHSSRLEGCVPQPAIGERCASPSQYEYQETTLRVVTVETVHKTARRAAIIGAIAGFVGGYLGSCGGGDEGTCWPEIGALFAGIGAGGGALVGAAYDHARASQHVIYSRGAGSGARLTPLVTRGGGGVGVAVGC